MAYTKLSDALIKEYQSNLKQAQAEYCKADYNFFAIPLKKNGIKVPAFKKKEYIKDYSRTTRFKKSLERRALRESLRDEASLLPKIFLNCYLEAFKTKFKLSEFHTTRKDVNAWRKEIIAYCIFQLELSAIYVIDTLKGTGYGITKNRVFEIKREYPIDYVEPENLITFGKCFEPFLAERERLTNLEK